MQHGSVNACVIAWKLAVDFPNARREFHLDLRWRIFKRVKDGQRTFAAGAHKGLPAARVTPTFADIPEMPALSVLDDFRSQSVEPLGAQNEIPLTVVQVQNIAGEAHPSEERGREAIGDPLHGVGVMQHRPDLTLLWQH